MSELGIRSLTLENFKSFRERTVLDLGNLTVLSGLNSSGKSSIYQAFLLLIQTLKRSSNNLRGARVPSLNLNGEWVELGEFSDILSCKDEESIKCGIGLENGTEVELDFSNSTQFDDINRLISFVPLSYLYFKLAVSNTHSVLMEAKLSGNNWNVKSYRNLVFEDPRIPYLVMDYLQSKIDKKFRVADEILLDLVEFDKITKIDMRDGFVNALTIPMKQLPKCFKPEYRPFLDLEDLMALLADNGISTDELQITNGYGSDEKEILDSVVYRTHYIGPFRGFPKKYYYKGNNVNYDLLLSSLILESSKIPCRFDFKNDVVIFESASDALEYWLVEHLGLAKSIEIRPLLNGDILQAILKNENIEVPINHMGFGTGQIVPVIYQVLMSPQGFFIVDEPEIHLHPSMQSKLADFFLNMAMIGKQVILETHSEHLINRLIYLTLKYPAIREKIRMYWVAHNGTESHVERIETDSLGFIVNAPAGFMDETPKLISELNAMRFERIDGNE